MLSTPKYQIRKDKAGVLVDPKDITVVDSVENKDKPENLSKAARTGISQPSHLLSLYLPYD